jgi:hypothetical protein
MGIGFQNFRAKLGRFPVFSLGDVRKLFPTIDKKRLVEWKQKGYILGVSRGFYAWPDLVTTQQDKWALACKVYAPAYISLQSALSHFGFIPEGVFSVTAITTHKTRSFALAETGYYYRTMQPSLFFGYTIQKAQNGMPFRMVYPEKLLLDWLYLNPMVKQSADFESLRWNKQMWRESLSESRLSDFRAHYPGPAFGQQFNVFKQWLHD